MNTLPFSVTGHINTLNKKKAKCLLPDTASFNQESAKLYEPRHGKRTIISYDSNKSAGKSAHPGRLARTCAVRTRKR